MRIDTKNFDANKYSMCVYQSCGISKDSGQYSTLAPNVTHLGFILGVVFPKRQ